MRRAAIEAADARLHRVREARKLFESGRLSRVELRTAWAHFLLAANGVYSKLQQGAKGSSQSEQWFAQKLAERKADPLLQYIHQARNAEEHSVEGSDAEHGIRITPANKWTTVLSDGSDGKPIRISTPSGKKPSGKLHAPGIHLRPVTNRGVSYNPPTLHLGIPLPERSILGVVSCAERYLTEMIAEAKSLLVEST